MEHQSRGAVMDKQEAILEAMLAEIQKNNQLIRGVLQTINESNVNTSEQLDDLEKEFMERSIADNKKRDEIRKTIGYLLLSFCAGIVIFMIIMASVELGWF